MAFKCPSQELWKGHSWESKRSKIEFIHSFICKKKKIGTTVFVTEEEREVVELGGDGWGGWKRAITAL